MNRTNVEHAAFALLIQLAVLLVTGDVWLGAALGTGFFLGREHAQREYQITRGGPVGGLEWWEGFRGWSHDARMDALLPVLACSFAGLVFEWWVR